jgi:hypothetical protein
MVRFERWWIGLISCALLWPSAVRAETENEATRWYGYQAMLTDAAAIGMFYGGVSTFRLCFHGEESNRGCDNGASGALLLGSLATYSFAAPVIHLAHGHPGKAGASFGIRAAPWLIAVPLSQTESPGAAGLFITSIFMAMVIDDGLLAREPVTEPAVQLGAVVDPGTGGAMISIGRQF